MELILITKSRKRIDIRCNAFCLAFVLLLSGFILVGGVFYLGSEYGLVQSRERITQFYEDAGRLWSRQVNDQRVALEDARQDAEKNLDTMAARLSQLQAHVLRLNALGSRLAQMADLDELEFDSDLQPGLGGPLPSVQVKNTVPDFLAEMEQLALAIEDRGDKLVALESLLIDRTLQMETLPHGSPLSSGWTTSLFGWRTDPLTGKKEFHEGLDLAAKSGTKITAVGGGIITWSGFRTGYGRVVEINHGNGYVTRYAHNRKNLVAVGEKVKKGQEIAVIGSSGRSTGVHVHFEVLHNGKHVNPRKFIALSQSR